MSAIWDKITGRDDDDPKQRPVATPQKGHPQNLPPPIPVTENRLPGGGKTDWADKFRDLLDGGASNKREAEEEQRRLEQERIAKEEAARQAEEAASWKGKLKGLFQSDEEEEKERQRLAAEAERKRREAEAARNKENSWKERIKDVFDNDDEEKERERQRLAEEAKRNQSFGAKVRGIFDRTPEPEPPKSKTEKIFGVLEGKPNEPEEKRGWLHEKLNSAAGGGAKAERNEDALDKTIDLFQQHVLREGPQHNESAAEQHKDELISDTIRKGYQNLTGKEFFVADKKH